MKSSIRIALLAAVAVAGMAACTSTPASQNHDAPQTSSTPTSETSAPPPPVVTEVVTQTVTNSPKPDAVVNTDNRIGYGALKLGMTLDEVKATGMAPADFGSVFRDGCWVSKEVVVSKKVGLVRIKLPAEAKTSKGIGVGSTISDVKRAYPDAKEYRDGLETRLGDHASYGFISNTPGRGMFLKDTDDVTEIKIFADGADCAMSDLR